MDIGHLHALRDAELQLAMQWFPEGVARVLDIGAGTGHQAQRMSSLGYLVSAVDLPSSSYAADRIFEITDYDGVTLPLAHSSVDVVFSSNVLEHVTDIPALLAECIRVLAPGGIAIHILPTPAWRIWTTLGYYPWLLKRFFNLVQNGIDGAKLRPSSPGRRLLRMLVPERHGERGNFLTETWHFSEWCWKRIFVAAGYQVIHTEPVHLAYTGNMLVGSGLSLSTRRRLANLFGSSCKMYVLRPAKRPQTA
jgi:SAM-dependent methyltransferase